MTLTNSTVPPVLVDVKHKQTKLAADQFIFHHLLVIFNEICYFTMSNRSDIVQLLTMLLAVHELALCSVSLTIDTEALTCKSYLCNFGAGKR